MIINKYMRRGIWMLLAGIAFILLGYLIKINEYEFGSGLRIKYGWSMIIGVLLFGAGFLYILYSLIRKVERHAIIEERSGNDTNG